MRLPKVDNPTVMNIKESEEENSPHKKHKSMIIRMIKEMK
jgi:hypothetical protein